VTGRGERPDGTVSWRELLAEAEAVLGDLPGGALDARRIVEDVAGATGADLLDVLDDLVTVRGVARLDALVARRRAGEPLQYVLGHWSFRTLDLLVDRRVLIPRPETEMVAEVALAEVDRVAASRTPVRVADLGTGSGALALAIAVERPVTEVWATDVSDDALAVARANLAALGRPATRVRIATGSWFEALPDDLVGRFDVIVSNPPYVAEGDDVDEVVAAWEPALALWSGPTGLDALQVVVGGADRWLTTDGALVVELAPTQAATVAGLARAAGFGDVRVVADLAGRDRIVVARRGSGTGR
jgi:release factor glutamine methyltransferase